MNKNKEIYKVGDIVYYHFSDKGCVKGKVTLINPSKSIYNKFPIKVAFKGIEVCFTKDGRSLTTSLPTLSFAPYDFVNGGFTQERPLSIIEVDTLVYYKDPFDSNNVWRMGYFYQYRGKDISVFPYQRKSTDYENGFHKKTGDPIGFGSFSISQWSLTNPL